MKSVFINHFNHRILNSKPNSQILHSIKSSYKFNLFGSFFNFHFHFDFDFLSFYKNVFFCPPRGVSLQNPKILQKIFHHFQHHQPPPSHPYQRYLSYRHDGDHRMFSQTNVLVLTTYPGKYSKTITVAHTTSIQRLILAIICEPIVTEESAMELPSS